METETKTKKGIWEKLGSVSQNTVSLLATIAISIAIIFPAVIAFVANTVALSLNDTMGSWMGYVREKNEEKHNEISNTNDVL